MRTPWKLLVDVMSKSFRKRSENFGDSTRAMRSTDGPDEDSQQSPEHTETQPRADRSVAGCSEADLEQTAAQSPGKMLQNLEQTTDELEREKTRARKLHQTKAKPANSEVQNQVSKDGRIQQKDCAQQQVKRKHHPAEKTSSQNSKSVGRSRVHARDGHKSHQHT